MLSVRVTAPQELALNVVRELENEPTVCGIARVPGAALGGRGDLVMFDIPRENANNILRMLRHAGVPAEGGIAVSEPLTVISDAAVRAETIAPGHPADGVLWAQLADKSREDARPSGSFFMFLLLATLLAGIGRLLDQPILIIGAMVVGPEFAPVAAICYAIVRRRAGIVGPATVTLLGGCVVCIAISTVVWVIAYAAGVMTYEQATTGALTDFVVSPDGWSFAVAVVAGVAGVLSLTSAKSTALVGAFISVTTVPAVGAIAVTVAVGAWSDAASAGVQLVINLSGLLVAGTATLWVQLHVGRRVGWVAVRRKNRLLAQRRNASAGVEESTG